MTTDLADTISCLQTHPQSYNVVCPSGLVIKLIEKYAMITSFIRNNMEKIIHAQP